MTSSRALATSFERFETPPWVFLLAIYPPVYLVFNMLIIPPSGFRTHEGFLGTLFTLSSCCFLPAWPMTLILLAVNLGTNYRVKSHAERRLLIHLLVINLLPIVGFGRFTISGE